MLSEKYPKKLKIFTHNNRLMKVLIHNTGSYKLPQVSKKIIRGHNDLFTKEQTHND